MVTVMRGSGGRSCAGRYCAGAAVTGLLWCVALAPLASGQQLAPATPGSAEPREGRRLIETIRIWKMTEALGLDEDQAAKLFPKLNQLEASRREFYTRQRLLRGELAELLKQRPLRDQEIKARLEQLDRAEADFRGREQAIRGGLRSILSLEQQARLALFEDRFETEMRRAILELRVRRQGLAPIPGQGLGAPPVRPHAPIPVQGGPPPR